jgi:CrcB protein
VTSLALVGLVAVGGGAGSVLRWWAERRVTRQAPGGMPGGTLLVNVAGSALLGVLVGADAPPAVLALLGSGLCGGVTTFSGVCLQAVGAGRLSRRRAARYVGATLVLGVAAATLGWFAGELVAQIAR